MRRLWVQLSIVFSAVVVISGILYIVSLALVNRPDLSPPYPNPEVIALIRANRIPLIMTIVASTVGISTGILFSRVLTGPLDELTAAARDFGAGDMSRRVAVHGSQEIVELGETFNRMAADIQHAEALRRNLVADVAHELRTPLSVLQGNLRAILDDVYPLEKTEIARLYDQTRHLSRLVADLHDLASAEANSLTLYRQPVDLAALVENLTAAFRPVAAAQSITLESAVQADLPQVVADEDRLRQVVDNLLSNALRHTPPGGTISVAVETSASDLRIIVRDTGEGIPPGQLATIFDRFARLDRSRTRSTGGSGLGLAISRAIVEAHEGTIAAYSSGRGHGATFVVRLPIHTPATRAH